MAMKSLHKIRDFKTFLFLYNINISTLCASPQHST